MNCAAQEWLRLTVLLFIVQTVATMLIPNATQLEGLLEKYMDEDGEWWVAKQRGKRAITESDMKLILDLHNKLRGEVYPPASNMEYMVRYVFFFKVLKSSLNLKQCWQKCETADWSN